MPDKQRKMGEGRKVALIALAYWIAASALAACCYKLTISDVVFRYVPMADAFARGDWSLAFHPRFGVLFQVLSGVLVRLGFSAESAVRIVPFLFVALGAVVMWRVARTLFGSTVAWWTFLILLFEPLTTGYAMAGWRDPCKCLALALLALGAVERKPWAYGLGLMTYIMLFSYGFATSCLFLLAWCAWFVRKREWRMLPGPVLGWGAGTFPVTLMTYAFTGYWLPVPHVIEIYEKLRGCL